MIVAGLDSSSEPSPAQIAQAYLSGVRVWGGYIGPGAYHDWSPATYANVRRIGMGAIAFAFPGSDPGAMRGQANNNNALLCLDNALGDTANPYAASSATWLATARQGGPVGMYGQPAVLRYWAGHYDFAVVCGSGNNTSNNPLGLSVPCGNQYWNTHSEFGMSVDRGFYDPWFQQQQHQPEEDEMQVVLQTLTPSEGIWALYNGGYFHVADPDSENGFLAALETAVDPITGKPAVFISNWNVDDAQHAELKAKFGAPTAPSPTLAGQLAVSGTLQVAAQ